MLLLFGYIWVYLVIVGYLKEIKYPVNKRDFLSCTPGDDEDFQEGEIKYAMTGLEIQKLIQKSLQE